MHWEWKEMDKTNENSHLTAVLGKESKEEKCESSFDFKGIMSFCTQRESGLIILLFYAIFYFTGYKLQNYT